MGQDLGDEDESRCWQNGPTATSRREHPVLLARARVHMRVRAALPGASRAQVIGVDVRRTTRVKRESGSYRILNYRMLKLLETVD